MSEGGGAAIQIVVLSLNGEVYGIDIYRVREILASREITPVPHAQPHLRGLINLRGRTLPVVDLRARLGMTPAGADTATRIIVIDIAEGQVGVLVDAVTEVAAFDAEGIERPSEMLTAGGADFVLGVARKDERLITILDIDKLLSAMAA